jgi:class 3 adenylate cyclase/tetratricopeptide (TPR) repeat protein
MPTPTLIQLMGQALDAERLGQFDKARDVLRQAIALDPSSGSLDARLLLGRLLSFGTREDQAEAEDQLTVARDQAEQDGASRKTATAIHLLALLERHRGRRERAEQLLQESPVAGHATIPGPERAQWLHYYGLLELDRGSLNNAERSFFRALQIYREARDEASAAQVCDSLANLLVRRGKSRVAEMFARMSLASKRAVGDRHGEAITLGTLGRACLLQARYDEAAEALAADLEIARELGDRRGVGIMLNSLGEVELLRKDLRAAEGYYREALGVEAGPAHASHVHIGLARALLAGGLPDDAAAECDQVGATLDAHPELIGLPDVLLGLRGAVAWRRGDYAEGERQLVAAIAALEAGGHTLDTVPLLYELRDLYQAQQWRAKAVGVMARALDLLSECGSERGVDDVKDWLRTVDTPKLIQLALERHFPEYLVEEILSSRMRRPRTRTQEVAVLFSDVRDYTTLTEGLGAEQIVELLNEWFTEATRAIRRHRGVVDKFIGDAVMALFGVPEPREDAAADAVRAALEMRDALAAMNMLNEALGGREIRIGIGIDCGKAVVGFIGSHLRQSYTAIGDTVNTASRLESATKEYRCDTLISGAVEEVQQRFHVAETQFVGKLRLKGRTQEEPAYKVLGPRAEMVSSRTADHRS